MAVAKVVEHILAAGYEISVVGGAVRDVLLGKPIPDWDLTTNAHPEQILKIFPDAFYENTFGTVGVAAKHVPDYLPDPESNELETTIEVTTYRSDEKYEVDHRRPSSFSWGSTLSEDLSRRDFTMNAIAWKITGVESANLMGQIYDPFDGQKDLAHKRLITVGPARNRLEEDALRILRGIRFSAQLELQIDPCLVVAMRQTSDLLEGISWERKRDELFKILLTNHIEDAFHLMATTNVLQHLIPELLATRGIEQRGHHVHDVWKHTLLATQNCPSTDPVVKFATLLHDIAKPHTQEPIPNADGEFSFHHHEVIGARVAKEIAKRLRLSKEDIQRVFLLVRWHMFHYQTDFTDAAIRRFLRRIGTENLDDMMALREGDRLGSGRKRTSWRLEEMKERIYAELHQPMKVTDLAVDGNDLMNELELKPGKVIGDLLQKLLEQVLDDPTLNEKSKLIEIARTLLAKIE